MALSNELVDGWQPDPTISKWAEQSGFGKSRAMTEHNLRALGKTRGGRPSGIYLWEGAAHEIYIGISSESVTRRLRAHARDYPQANIQAFRYMPGGRNSTGLRDAERKLIYDAIRAGFDCFNTEHAASIYGDSPFDEKISVTRQRAWFNNPANVNASAPIPPASLTAAQRSRANKKYPQFIERPYASEVIDVISLYLRCCVPFPAETQSEYWGLTCLPNTKLSGKGFKRVRTLNMGMIEMLWLTETPDGDLLIEMGTDHRFLPPHSTARNLRKVGAVISDHNHASGGPYEAILLFQDTESFLTALKTSQHIRVAAARFALDRMRKSRLSGRYRDAHNHLLAADVIKRLNQWDVASRPLDDIYDPEVLA